MKKTTALLTSFVFAISFFLLPFQVGAQATDADVLRARIVEMTEQVGRLYKAANMRAVMESRCTDVALHRNLYRGSSGFDVSNLQTYLRNRGYYNGPVNGFYGSQTAQAVQFFKADHGVDWLWTAGTVKTPGVTDGITRALLRKMCQ